MTFLDPWLGLRARLFLSLFPYGLVALLFVGTRLLISSSQVNTDIQHSNATIWSACRETEQAVSTLVSFPHLLAVNFNNATRRSVDDTVRGLGEVLLFAITAVEALLVFLVDMYRSMFLCFMQFVVQASISLLISAVQLFSTAVHDIAQSIQTTIQASIDGINTALSTTLSGLNDILSIIGKSITIPQVPYPNLSALSNVTMPNTLEDSLIQLNNSLPTLADLKARIDELIQTPFEQLKTQVNETITNYAFNQSALPVPSRQAISFCNDTLDTSPLQDLNHDLAKAAHIGIGLLVVLAVLFLIFNVFREWYSWRCLKNHVASTREAFIFSHGSEKTEDTLEDRTLMSLLQLSTHPLLAVWGLRMAERMGIRSTEGKDRVRWWLAWISHPIGIVLLIMGLVGLLSVEMQLIAVDKIDHHYQDRFQNMTDQSVNGIQGRIDAVLQGMSTEYANASNIVLLQSQSALNDHLFDWVNVTTSTMNNTLNEFMDGIATVINETFSNTPLFSPVQSFIDCIIGQKVKGIEDGLTWIQSNAHVSFPIVPDDILMVNPNATQEVIQPLTNSTLGSNGILADVIGSYERSLQKERLMFIIILLLYLLLFVIGTLIAITGGRLHSIKLFRSRREHTPSRQDSTGTSPFHDFITSGYYGNDPAPLSTSHQSISKPLHPDVVSLYQQQMSPLPTQGPLVAANRIYSKYSWENFLDKCDSSSQHRQETCGNKATKQGWLHRVPSYRSSSVDSAYDPAAEGSYRSDIVEQKSHEGKLLSFWLWKNRQLGEAEQCTLQQQHDKSNDSLRRQSIPIVNSPSLSAKDLPKYPASCDSGLETGSLYSEQSRDSQTSDRHHSGHRQNMDSNHFGKHLSYISEQPESCDKESLEMISQRLTRPPSPRLSFGFPEGANEITLQRNTQESLQRPGRAL